MFLKKSSQIQGTYINVCSNCSFKPEFLPIAYEVLIGWEPISRKTK